MGDVELQPGEAFTFKGRLSTDYTSQVRFTISDNRFEGMIYTGNEKFFITEAGRFSPNADANDMVVYRQGDLKTPINLENDVQGRISAVEEMSAPQMLGAVMAGLREIEIATDADFQWVQQSGGTAASANNEILGILNMVDGIYERDIDLTVAVTFQHAWTTPDPWPSTDQSALLSAFGPYWNANYPASQFPRDTAHLRRHGAERYLEPSDHRA